MNTYDARRSGGYKRTTMVVALTMVLSTLGWVTQTAQAVTLGSLVTRMEIDGNKANAAGFDWNNMQDGTLPGGYVISANVVSAGVVAVDLPDRRAVDNPVMRRRRGTPTSVVDGSKLDQNRGPSNRACRTRRAHLLRWRRSRGTVNVNGAVALIRYEYYTRTPSATGDQSVVMSNEGPLAGRCDDLLIDYNFGPSSGSVTTLYRWTRNCRRRMCRPAGRRIVGRSLRRVRDPRPRRGPNPWPGDASARSCRGPVSPQPTAPHLLAGYCRPPAW